MPWLAVPRSPMVLDDLALVSCYPAAAPAPALLAGTSPTGEKSPILTVSLGGRGRREMCSWFDLDKLLDFIIFWLAILFYIIAKLGF